MSSDAGTEVQFTPEQMGRIIAHVSAKWGEDRSCPMCGTNVWGIDRVLYQLPVVSPGGFTVPYRFQPMASLNCKNCHFTALVNLFSSGIMPADELTAMISKPQTASVPADEEAGHGR